MALDYMERARRYVARLEAAVSGSGGHDRTFHVACVLVQGFALTDGEAMEVLREYNQRCVPPWTEKELSHKVQQAGESAGRRPVGWLRHADSWRPNGEWKEERPGAVPAEVVEPPKVTYDADALRKVAGDLAGVVDSVWLANRSWEDPATIKRGEFLDRLYDRKTEKVVVFTSSKSQGQALWPDEKLPDRGREGVWFLAAPVDGRFRETGEKDKLGQPKTSRRNAACVTSWRWAVLESDTAPAREWLGALARLPLRVAAIYTSGKRSVHALVNTRARTKAEWDGWKAKVGPMLVLLGADPRALTAVRLTRLPCCYREESGRWQKLLFLNPRADGRPLVELPVVRDVEAWWGRLLEQGPADSDETGGEWIIKGASHYASRSARIRALIDTWESGGR